MRDTFPVAFFMGGNADISCDTLIQPIYSTLVSAPSQAHPLILAQLPKDCFCQPVSLDTCGEEYQLQIMGDLLWTLPEMSFALRA